jgi:hypothetical protein
MADFAYSMIRGLSVPATSFWLGAFQPHCGGSGEPPCVNTWTGWDWVDDTPNGNLDCGSMACGKSLRSDGLPAAAQLIWGAVARVCGSIRALLAAWSMCRASDDYARW